MVAENGTASSLRRWSFLHNELTGVFISITFTSQATPALHQLQATQIQVQFEASDFAGTQALLHSLIISMGPNDHTQ